MNKRASLFVAKTTVTPRGDEQKLSNPRLLQQEIPPKMTLNSVDALLVVRSTSVSRARGKATADNRTSSGLAPLVRSLLLEIALEVVPEDALQHLVLVVIDVMIRAIRALVALPCLQELTAI